MRSIFYLIRYLFRKFGYDLELINLLHPNPIRLYDFNPSFCKLYDEIKERSALSSQSLSILYQLARSVQSKNGSMAEIGAYKGGSAYLMASASPNKTVHVFDTFEGMPEVSEYDAIKKGMFNVDANEVFSFLNKKNNIRIYKGIFPSTAGQIENESFSLVHIDVDIYQSVKECLNFFYSRMSKEGILLSDDYGQTICPGAKKAWDEFFADKSEKSIYLPTGQCFVIKE